MGKEEEKASGVGTDAHAPSGCQSERETEIRVRREARGENF